MVSDGKERRGLFASDIVDVLLKGEDKNKAPELVSPLLLAFIGDSIYDICIRTALVKKGNRQVNKLHKQASEVVSATAQAQAVKRITPFLSDEEKNILRRGRNVKFHTKAKNATSVEYKAATGFEALLGYLYLKDDHDRILELVNIATDGAY